MGTQRGRLGQSVLARRNGEQIQRAYVGKIANPRSTGQNYQRMVFATAAAAASALNGIIDHSFEGIKYGQDSRSFFMKEATKMLRGTMQRSTETGWAPAACGSYVIKGAGVLVPNYFKVSKGTLTAKSVLGNLKTNIQGISNALVMQSELLTEAFENNAEIYAEYLRDVFGCEPGDQLTFIFCGQDTDEAHAVASYNGKNNFQSYVQVARVVFKPFEDIQVEADMLSLFSAVEGDSIFGINPAIVSERSINAGDVLFKADGSTTLIATGASPITIFAAAMIRSKQVGGSWLRSNAFLSVNARAIGPVGPDVVGSYGNNAEVSFGSDRYLNNAVPAEQAENTAIPAGTVNVLGVAFDSTQASAEQAPMYGVDNLNEDASTPAFIAALVPNVQNLMVGFSDSNEAEPSSYQIMTSYASGKFVTTSAVTTPATDSYIWFKSYDGAKSSYPISLT